MPNFVQPHTTHPPSPSLPFIPKGSFPWNTWTPSSSSRRFLAMVPRRWFPRWRFLISPHTIIDGYPRLSIDHALSDCVHSPPTLRAIFLFAYLSTRQLFSCSYQPLHIATHSFEATHGNQSTAQLLRIRSCPSSTCIFSCSFIDHPPISNFSPRCLFLEPPISPQQI